MAKRAKNRFGGNVKVLRAPTPVIRVSAPASMPRYRRAKALAVHGGRVALKRAWEEKHTLAAVAASAGLGLLESQGVDLPALPVLGTAGTYGLGLWMAGKWMKSTTLSHMATGLLCVAAHDFAKGAKKLQGEF